MLKKFFLQYKKQIIYILVLFCVTRIMLGVIGVSSRIIMDDYKDYDWQYSQSKIFDIWGVWDSGYYLGIAENGYSINIGATKMTDGQANYVFFPLYPLLIKGLGIIIGNYYLAGLFISNLAFLVAVFYLFLLTKHFYDEDTAYRSIKYIFLFPTAFILSGVFTEAIFLMLLMMTFYYAEKNNWLLSGIFGFLLALSRPVGVFMFIPLCILYFNKNRVDNRFKLDKNVLFLFLLPLGLFIFLFYVHNLTGNVFDYWKVKRLGWGHELTEPFSVLIKAMFSKDIFIFINAWISMFVLVLITLNWKKIGLVYFIAGIISFFLPILTGPSAINSMSRYMLAVFPIYFVISNITKNKNVDSIVMIIFSMLQAFLMVFWVNGFHLTV